MRSAKILALLCGAMLASAVSPIGAEGDVIRFTRGGAQKCVIIEEDEESVQFRNSMGIITTPRSRIKSIERESGEENEKLTEEWEQQEKKARAKKPKPKPKPKKEELTAKRTYNIELTRRRIMLGGRDAGVADGQQVAAFVIKDMGIVEGCRLFDVDVISYRGGIRSISAGDFHAFLRNGVKIDAAPLEEHKELDANLAMQGKASGSVAFPVDAKLETLELNSEVANFTLDLETGDFETQDRPF